MLCYVISCCVKLYMLCHAVSCCVMLYHVALCCIMLCYVVSCCVMLYHVVLPCKYCIVTCVYNSLSCFTI